MRKNERSIVMGDLHVPFDDKRAVSLVLKFIKKFKPDNIFLNGDIIDCWEISKFERPLSINVRLEQEIREVKEFLARLKEASDASIIYIFGNHEHRFERFIARNAKELYGLKGLTLEEQLGLAELEITVINNHQRENYYRYGKLLIGHFNKVNKHGGYTAKNLREEKGMSLIQNHTHRGGFSPKRDYASLKAGWENFCLCDLNPTYCSLPDWQLGFSEIFMDIKSGVFEVHLKMIVDYKIIYGDNVIKA